MGSGWLSQFEFTDVQRQELLAIVGMAEAEGERFLDNMAHAIRVCRADMSEELSPAETAKRLKKMHALARELSKIWPLNTDFDILLGHGFRGATVPLPFGAANAMIVIVDDIAIACTRALEELKEHRGKPRRGRRHNAEVIALAAALSRCWRDEWETPAPSGKMLQVLKYLITAAETTGDARRALEIVLPPAEKKRGKVRRTPAKSRHRP